MNLKDPRPYIIWAHIQWLDESNATPHIVIQNGSSTMFPPSLQAHSIVTFNISAEAINGLNLDENGLSFSARFSGKEFKIYAPLDCLLQLHSADKQVNIGLQRSSVKQESQDPLPVQQPQSKSIPTPPPKHRLAVIGGGASDGVSRGKLSLVPSHSFPEPDEPEVA